MDLTAFIRSIGPDRMALIKFHEIEDLAKGTEATTCKGYFMSHGRPIYAVRKIYKPTKMVPEEVAILGRALKPPQRNILQTFQFEHTQNDDDTVSMIGYYELCEGGDLHDHLDNAIVKSEAFIWHVFISMARALIFLHHGRDAENPLKPKPHEWCPVTHNDIKPDNIFLSHKPCAHRPFPTIILGDFGIATAHTKYERRGTPGFLPPEPYTSPKRDIYSLGVTMYFCIVGAFPPRGRNLFPWEEDKLNEYSDALLYRMQECVRDDMDERPDAKELLNDLEVSCPDNIAKLLGICRPRLGLQGPMARVDWQRAAEKNGRVEYDGRAANLDDQALCSEMPMCVKGKGKRKQVRFDLAMMR